MRFESELKKGNFVIGYCKACNKTSWPPSDFCSECFGPISWKKASKFGKLIEYSKKDSNNFCVTEFDNGIRIMGTLNADSKNPKVGAKVIMEKCRIKDGNYIFVMRTM